MKCIRVTVSVWIYFYLSVSLGCFLHPVYIYRLIPLFIFLRTLITGMASGSIVAFNIDFNRWHYEHQSRYWGRQHEEEEDREKSKRGRRCLLCVCDTGETMGTKGKEDRTGPYALFPCVLEEAAAPVEHMSSKHTCTYTRTCNHRHIISWRYTPKLADIIDRVHFGDKERVMQALSVDYTCTTHRTGCWYT